MLMHPFDSQKNEALNRSFTKHAPKNIVFSKTFSLFDRLAFVIIIDSVGYEGALKRLLADLFKQHDNVPDDVQLGWAQREDTFKTYILERQRTKKEKIRQTAEKKIKLKANREENTLARCKGDFYGRGLALQTETDGDVVAGTTATAPISKGAKRAAATKCKCGMMDHQRISYNKCKLNPKNIALWAKAAEQEEAAKNERAGNALQESNPLVES